MTEAFMLSIVFLFLFLYFILGVDNTFDDLIPSQNKQLSYNLYNRVKQSFFRICSESIDPKKNLLKINGNVKAVSELNI